MDIATDKPNWRSVGVKAAFIFGANLLIAAAVIGPIALVADADPFHPGSASEGWAAFVGVVHLMFGATALAMRASARFIDDPVEADDLRWEGSALLLGGAALIAAGASMVLLSVTGPGGPVPAKAVLAGALALNALAMILVSIRLRVIDEMNRAAARDAGYLTVTWFSLIGGTWGIAAHLDLARAPAPLEWLTMLWGFGFLAGLVAVARRGGFDKPGQAK